MEDSKGPATLAARQLARWILQQELGKDTSGALLDAAEHAWRHLSQSFAQIVTAAATEVLLNRAIHLARREFPLLAAVPEPLRQDAWPIELVERLEGPEADTVTEAVVAVIAHVIALLSTFVGEALVLRRLDDIWPGIPGGPSGEEMQP